MKHLLQSGKRRGAIKRMNFATEMLLFAADVPAQPEESTFLSAKESRFPPLPNPQSAEFQIANWEARRTGHWPSSGGLRGPARESEGLTDNDSQVLIKEKG